MHTRKVKETFRIKETLEGAGVRLHRGFGNFEVPRFDPFLLFDDFSSPNPADYLAGFPWHPHRGIETVTYVLDGDVRHRDSIGNSGVITRGDIQWMTAGSGIIHEEMPEGTSGMAGFQLWVNLPQKEKLMSPRYQEYKSASIPEVALSPGVHAKVIAGTASGVSGPITDIVAGPQYLDVTIEPERSLVLPVISGHTAFVYLFEGELGVGHESQIAYTRGMIILLEREGDTIEIASGGKGARFLFVSGQPIGEPVAWRGPIVMNTKDEIVQAFTELAEGTFIR